MFGIDDFLIGAAVSGGSSFLSGLFGRSGAKKRAAEEVRRIEQANRANRDAAKEMNRQVRARADKAAKVPIVTKQVGQGNLAAMVTDAVKNGFNPLTVLRSGGQAYYAGSTTTVTGSTAMDAALAGQHIATLQPLISQTQVPSTGEVFGNALQAMAGSFTSMMSTNQAQQFQMDLLGMQIAGANANSLFNHNLSRSFATPTAQVSGPVFKDGNGGYQSWDGGGFGGFGGTGGSGGGMYPGAAGLVFEKSVFDNASRVRDGAMRRGATSNSLERMPWLATDQQTLENIYGEMSDIEGFTRWVNERGGPAIAQVVKDAVGPAKLNTWGNGIDIPWPKVTGGGVIGWLTTGRWNMPNAGFAGTQ